MKKILAVLMGTLLFPAVSFAAFDVDLRYGSSGAEVFELQEFLTAQGVYAGPITGNFYSLTLMGVKAYQAKEGVVPQSGYFGPLTRAKANATLSVELEDSDREAATTTPVVTDPTPKRTTRTSNTSGSGENSAPAAPLSLDVSFTPLDLDKYGNKVYDIVVTGNYDKAQLTVTSGDQTPIGLGMNKGEIRTDLATTIGRTYDWTVRTQYGGDVQVKTGSFVAQ